MEKEAFKFGYVPELDGMRGIAILVVMVFHAIPRIFTGGFIGVDIFFVISGFLITALLIKEYDRSDHISLKNFYLRRILRLIPALILLLLVFSILSIIFLNAAEAKSNLIASLIVLFYSSNWDRAFQIHALGFLQHTWSLSIEEQFYILWPITLRFLLRHIRSRWNIFFLISFLVLFSWGLRVYLGRHGASIERLYNGLDTRADALLIGCALGIALSSHLIGLRLLKIFSRILQYLSPISALILVGVVFTINWRSMFYYNWLLFVIEMLTAILILDMFTLKGSILKLIFSKKLLVWIGSISYGLYLWHYPIFSLMKNHYDDLQILLYGSIITFIIATGSYYLLEHPFLKLKDRFSSIVINNKSYKPIVEPLIPNSIEEQNNHTNNIRDVGL